MSGSRAVQLSTEMSHLKRSVMRDLLRLAVDPGIISLAGGLPASDEVPTEAFKACLNKVIERDGAASLQYSPPYAPLQAWIAEAMVKRGVSCAPEQVFVTNGAQQGLAILSRLLLDPGATAVVEAVTFTGIQQVTAGRGAEVRPVAIDPALGVDLAALEHAFQASPKPKLAIIIPSFHNPLSATLSSEARQRIAELAASYEVPLLEDDPYSELRFEGQAVPPIKAFDEDGWVFYIGSFSKWLSPGVRLGWIVAPADLIPQITVVRESFDLESSTLIQRAVYEFGASGALDEHVKRLNAVHKRRRDALLSALEEHFSGSAEWTRPLGGLFVWMTLAEAVDTWDLFHSAVERKVAFVPGSAFAVGGGQQNAMRLSFGNVNETRIGTAVTRLAEAVREGVVGEV